jgi:hypothetical protein
VKSWCDGLLSADIRFRRAAERHLPESDLRLASADSLVRDGRLNGQVRGRGVHQRAETDSSGAIPGCPRLTRPSCERITTFQSQPNRRRPIENHGLKTGSFRKSL